MQVRVHREEQGLQGEDKDLYQADPGHNRVDLSRAEQRLSGWLFARLQAGRDEDCLELREDHVHQVLGDRARSQEEDQRVWGADQAQHGPARAGMSGEELVQIF